MGALLRDAPPLAFESDRDVQWSVIDPWTGFLADSTYCESMRSPFIPGTAPTNLCHHGAYWDYAWGDLDSLYRVDSLYFADDGEPDTLEVTPAEPESDPELYADPDEPWDEPVEPGPENEEGSADPAEPPVLPSGDEPGG